MSGPRFRATALPRARDRWARLLLVVLVVSATFALFCVSAPSARAAESALSPGASVPPVATVAAPTGATPDELLEAGAPRHAGREPCEENPGHHHCDGPDHLGVLGHAPLVGADRATAPGQLATAPAHGSFAPSRGPGAARPPDLHELQLLRV